MNCLLTVTRDLAIMEIAVLKTVCDDQEKDRRRRKKNGSRKENDFDKPYYDCINGNALLCTLGECNPVY